MAKSAALDGLRPSPLSGARERSDVEVDMKAATTLSGFLRVAAAIPPVRVADVRANVSATLDLWRRAHREGVHIAWFPELGLTGYTAGDLFHDATLRNASDEAVAWLAGESLEDGLDPVVVVGLPIWTASGAFNCAVAIHRGAVLAGIPKEYLPTYGEFYEARHFRAGREGVSLGSEVRIGGRLVPFGTDILLRATTDVKRDERASTVDDQIDCLIGTEICEDGWVATTPAARHAAAGALVVGNLSGSPFSVGRGEARHRTCWKQSAPNRLAYVYTAAGPGESSADLAFDAHGMVYEAGTLLAESRRFAREPQLVVADVDIDALRRERVRTGTFGDAARATRDLPARYRHVPFRVALTSALSDPRRCKADHHRPLAGGKPEAIHVTLPLRRAIDPSPYVPADPGARATRCWEVFEIQVNALMTRMTHFANRHLVLALSGGRDSTLAALACVAALDAMALPRTNLTCVSMPGWGTSAATREASAALAHALGATFVEEEISAECELILEAQDHPAILAWRHWNASSTVSGELDRTRDARSERLKACGSDQLRDEGIHDDASPSGVPFVTFLAGHPGLADVELENVQARVRKLRVLTRANRTGALEVGTGDLSEKALGWSTYAGDQTALYDINCGVPKTLVSAVIRWVADERVAREAWSTGTAGSSAALREALERVLAAPITPELVPPSPDGAIVQLTESTLGPFAVHDFYLHHVIGLGATPSRAFAFAQIAFAGTYDAPSLRRWMRIFLVRFFRAQWKRDATPDGPKVVSLALSPRGDWRMPSDAVPDLWVADLDGAPDIERSLLGQATPTRASTA
jgi:NAD+ synthase (glutamine-hydrolysing)